MLLKVKIKYSVFERLDEILFDTKLCAKRIKRVRRHLFWQGIIQEQEFDQGKKPHFSNILDTELAFLLNETLEAIDRWVDEKKHSKYWLVHFTPEN